MEIQKFPGIPNWNSGSRESREFPGFTEWEFPVALAQMEWHQSILCEELPQGPYRPLFLALHSDCVGRGSSLTRYSPRYRRSNQSATAPHLYLCSVTLTFNHGALNLTISLILLFVIC